MPNSESSQNQTRVRRRDGKGARAAANLMWHAPPAQTVYFGLDGRLWCTAQLNSNASKSKRKLSNSSVPVAAGALSVFHQPKHLNLRLTGGSRNPRTAPMNASIFHFALRTSRMRTARRRSPLSR